MSIPEVSRRDVLLAASCAAVSWNAAASAAAAEAEPTPETPADALARLKAGNDRFVKGESIHRHESSEWRKRLTKGQKPFATILGCSDSRVPIELVFDQGFGDLFTIRIAGNIIAEDVAGSIQYASRHLGTSLYVVLGHESCGAVTAAVDAMLGKLDEPQHIVSLVKMITPGLANINRDLPREQLIASAVEANVYWSMKQLVRMSDSRKAMRDRSAELVGAVYNLESGTVRFLKTPPGLIDSP